jgi:hypothetical protein
MTDYEDELLGYAEPDDYDPDIWQAIENGEADNEELDEVFAGEYGPELQSRAEELYMQVDAEDGEDDLTAEEQEWADGMAAGIGQIEQKIGRQLSGREVDALIQRHATDPEPEPAHSYDEVVGRKGSKDDWQAAGAEIFEDHAAQLDEHGFDASGAPYETGAPQPLSAEDK